jgi:hypothetical protein
MFRNVGRADRRSFAILFVAGLLGVLAVLPFLLELVDQPAFAPREGAPELPRWAVLALAIAQNAILLAVVVALGIRLSKRVGLRMPLVRAWAEGVELPDARADLLSGLLVGAVAGAVLVGTEAAFFLKKLPEAMAGLLDVPLWKRLLAGVVYGGITEELLMRLFLMSLVAWLLGKRWRTADGLPTAGAFRTAIFLVAILFGLGHLPATAAITPLTSLMVTRALVLNGIAGLAFGHLYWRHGLEAAMAGHVGAHLVLQVPGFWLLKSLS